MTPQSVLAASAQRQRTLRGFHLPLRLLRRSGIGRGLWRNIKQSCITPSKRLLGELRLQPKLAGSRRHGCTCFISAEREGFAVLFGEFICLKIVCSLLYVESVLMLRDVWPWFTCYCWIRVCTDVYVEKTLLRYVRVKVCSKRKGCSKGHFVQRRVEMRCHPWQLAEQNLKESFESKKEYLCICCLLLCYHLLTV